MSNQDRTATPTVGRKRFAFDLEDLQAKGFTILSARMRPDQFAEAAEWPEMVRDDTWADATGALYVNHELELRCRVQVDAAAAQPVIYEVAK